MLRLPPEFTRTAPSFPSTTLVRSQAVIAAAKPNGGKPLTVRAFDDGDYRAFLIAKKARNRDTAQARVDEAIARTLRILGDLAGWHLSRSEEHTSELQSLMRI